MKIKNLMFSALVTALILIFPPGKIFAADKAKEFSLVAQQTAWEILPGVTVKALTFNGVLPGPQIRVKEGELVRIKVRNELPEPTSVHWHGLEVPYEMDGVAGVTQAPILPGKEFTYEFIAKPAGVRFYHSHVHEATQMTNAMHGAFIIEPAPDTQTKPDRHYILFLTEWQVHTKGSEAMSEMDFNFFTINGKSFPATANLAVSKGETVRITIINMGASYHPMHLHGHQFKIVAQDGNAVPPALQMTRNVVPLMPGESYDIEFIANNPGIWALHCHEPHHVMNNEVEPGGLITLIVYEGYESIAAKAKQTISAGKEKMENMPHMRH